MNKLSQCLQAQHFLQPILKATRAENIFYIMTLEFYILNFFLFFFVIKFDSFAELLKPTHDIYRDAVMNTERLIKKKKKSSLSDGRMKDFAPVGQLKRPTKQLAVILLLTVEGNLH